MTVLAVVGVLLMAGAVVYATLRAVRVERDDDERRRLEAADERRAMARLYAPERHLEVAPQRRPNLQPSNGGMGERAAELEPLRRVLPNPLTGEVLELDLATSSGLAAFRDWLGDLKRQIDATLVDVDEQLTAELDRDNVRSGRFADWEVTTEAPLETVWDVPALGLALEAQVQAGRITRKAAEAALEPQPPPPPKPRARELAKLLGHADTSVVEAVEACRRAEPRRRRRVTVKRSAPAQRRLSGAQGPQEGTR